MARLAWLPRCGILISADTLGLPVPGADAYNRYWQQMTQRSALHLCLGLSCRCLCGTRRRRVIYTEGDSMLTVDMPSGSGLNYRWHGHSCRGEGHCSVTSARRCVGPAAMDAVHCGAEVVSVFAEWADQRRVMPASRSPSWLRGSAALLRRIAQRRSGAEALHSVEFQRQVTSHRDVTPARHASRRIRLPLPLTRSR